MLFKQANTSVFKHYLTCMTLMQIKLKLLVFINVTMTIKMRASIAQSGERQTEDLKVPGSIPGRGMSFYFFSDIFSL